LQCKQATAHNTTADVSKSINSMNSSGKFNLLNLPLVMTMRD
jgi:hypothetical protein